jgi:DNA-binding Lrp family transcriptional regulator
MEMQDSSVPRTRSLLALVNIIVDPHHIDDAARILRQIPSIEEVHEVTGEFDLVTLISASDIDELRNIIKNRVLKIRGIKGTTSSLVLRSQKTQNICSSSPGFLV